MSYAAIVGGFEAKLRSGFTGGGDFNFEGSLYLPRAGRGYLSCRMSAYQRSPMALDARTPHEERGFYEVNVCHPTSEGPHQARLLVDRLVAFFPRGLAIPIPPQVITVEEASGQPAVPSGEWIVIPVLIQWFTTELAP